LGDGSAGHRGQDLIGTLQRQVSFSKALHIDNNCFDLIGFEIVLERGHNLPPLVLVALVHLLSDFVIRKLAPSEVLRM